MKTRNWLILLMFTVMITANYSIANAQATAKEVFDPQVKITFLGVDFTHAKCYGEERFNAADLALRINDLLRLEQEKYNLTAAFKKQSVDLKFDLIKKLDSTINDDKFFTNNPGELNKLSKNDVLKIVADYDFSGYEKGVGFVFIVDNLNKQYAEEVMWCVFVDMGTNSVIFAEKANGVAGGFGMRNYYARPFYEVIKYIKSDLFREWKRKYDPTKK